MAEGEVREQQDRAAEGVVRERIVPRFIESFNRAPRALGTTRQTEVEV